jgi:hypothetical protein
MATKQQQDLFIKQIAPLIQKYAKLNNYKCCSAIIAQAICESNWGLSKLSAKYYNYFGMKCGSSWKGRSVNMRTGEEYTVGVHTTINANFRAYNNMEDGVKGYFDFIKLSRYANLKTATTPLQYATMLKQDGYATSSTYIKTLMSIVNAHKLTQYDNFNTITKTTSKIVTKSPYLFNGVDMSACFDTKFYLNKYQDLKSHGVTEQNAFEHFCRYGMKEQRQASANFNVLTYAMLYPDLRQAYGCHWEQYYMHYCKYGKKENRKGI